MLTRYKLLEIREIAQLTQAGFAKRIGYSREVVNKVESGKTAISKRLEKAVVQFVQEHALTGFFDDVNKLGKNSPVDKIHTSHGFLQERRLQKNRAAEIRVPLVGIKAQAGYVKGFEQVDFVDALDKYALPPGVNPAGAVWRYFEIDGDSMEPTLSSGDVVLATMVPVEDWMDAKNFGVYIIHTEDQLLVKRIYKKSDTQWVLISDNDELYPQTVLNLQQVKQLWMFRRHIRSKAPAPKEVKITA